LTQVVAVGDTRKVTYEVCGAASASPIFLLHGTPGSHRGPRPRVSVLYRLGVRLISYDRPGYGDSTRSPGRVVADAADDVRAIADDLGIADFAVVGRSGGGPHALACAALLPDRVRSAAVLVGLAPSDASDLGWFDGMTDNNSRDYQAVTSGHAGEFGDLKARAEQVKENPASLLDVLGPDRRVVDDVTIRKQLTDTYAEALRDGTDGWLDDVIALRKPWGFELADIKQPVLLWHGAEDAFSPVSHAYWLASQISTARIDVANGASHFAAVEALPKALAWAKATAFRKAGDPECASTGGLR
jgi:pimeloyl-ACP methyl ester carboxylesterase